MGKIFQSVASDPWRLCNEGPVKYWMRLGVWAFATMHLGWRINAGSQNHGLWRASHRNSRTDNIETDANDVHEWPNMMKMDQIGEGNAFKGTLFFSLSCICRLFEGFLRRLYGKTNNLFHDLLEGEWWGIFIIMLAFVSLCRVRGITSQIVIHYSIW